MNKQQQVRRNIWAFFFTLVYIIKIKLILEAMLENIEKKLRIGC
jgi:hypothetical protein